MANPAAFIEHLRQSGYHPRSDKHSNAFAEAIVQDLVSHCPPLREKASSGELVYDLNFTITASTAEWNVDLVFGPPELGAVPSPGMAGVARRTPSTVEVAIEIKSVMTEHRKAVKNRKRDLEAHHEHVHNYNRQAIAGGVLVINASPAFRSPLRLTETVHRNPRKLVEHCVAELRAVSVRGDPPAPAVGDPLHYDAFIRTLCEQYGRRYGRRRR